MNYYKIYSDLIESRMAMKKERWNLKKIGYYFEGHHIIPKSKGGTGTSSSGLNHNNIVLLTAREHFLSHWILWRIYRDRSSALAFHKMMSSNINQNRFKSSRAYEEARMAFSETNKGNTFGKSNKGAIRKDLRGVKRPEHSQKMKGENNPFYNKKHSKLTIEKIREKAKNRHKECKSYNNKGRRVVFKDGILLKTFDTNDQVASFIKGTIHGVSNVLGGSQKTTRGYVVKYENLIN